MRNNVYSDTFWYGDMFLPVWANNEKFSKFHIQYIWKIVRGWHHQLAHLNIHKDWSRSVFRKKNEISKCHIFLISHPIFIIFSLFCRKKFTLSFKIDSILEWISPLRMIMAFYLITLDPRLPFPDSVGGIFPGPATTQKRTQDIEWFSQLAALRLTVLSMLIRGITIEGD